MNSPADIEWIEGELPPVESVPYKCRVLVWFITDISEGSFQTAKIFWPEFDPNIHNGQFSKIEVCLPWEDALNSLRWCGDNMMPIGHWTKVKYWAWLKRE